MIHTLSEGLIVWINLPQALFYQIKFSNFKSMEYLAACLREKLV